MGLAAAVLAHGLLLALVLRESGLGPPRPVAEAPAASVRIMSDPRDAGDAGTLSLAPSLPVSVPTTSLAPAPIRIAAERPRGAGGVPLSTANPAPSLVAERGRRGGALAWADYPEQVRAHLDRLMPQGAGEPVYVRFSVDRRGNVLSAVVERAGTDPDLAAAAIRRLRAASPLPPVPQSFQGASFAVTMAIPVARG